MKERGLLSMSVLVAALAAGTPAFARPAACERQNTDPRAHGVTLQAIGAVIAEGHPPHRARSKLLLDVGRVIAVGQKTDPVPAKLVRALPQYTGYRYFLAGSDMVIVHPADRRVAYIMPFCPPPHAKT